MLANVKGKHEVCHLGHMPTKLFYYVFLGVCKVFSLCFHVNSLNFDSPVKRYCIAPLQILNIFSGQRFVYCNI